MCSLNYVARGDPRDAFAPNLLRACVARVFLPGTPLVWRRLMLLRWKQFILWNGFVKRPSRSRPVGRSVLGVGESVYTHQYSGSESLCLTHSPGLTTPRPACASVHDLQRKEWRTRWCRCRWKERGPAAQLLQARVNPVKTDANHGDVFTKCLVFRTKRWHSCTRLKRRPSPFGQRDVNIVSKVTSGGKIFALKFDPSWSPF